MEPNHNSNIIDKNELNKKMNFENIQDNREAFYKESEEFSDTFKEGQDFEFVKYKLSQVLEVNQEQIVYIKNLFFRNYIIKINLSFRFTQFVILDLQMMIKLLSK